jgi:hypothetical protein
MKRKRERRIVKVLNLIESAKSGIEKYIKFTQRLHPWTTIKVRLRFQNLFIVSFIMIIFIKSARLHFILTPTSEKYLFLIFLATEINNSLNYGISRAQIKIIFWKF